MPTTGPNPRKPKKPGTDPYRKGNFLIGFREAALSKPRRKRADGTRFTRSGEGGRVAVNRRRNRAARAARRRQRV